MCILREQELSSLPCHFEGLLQYFTFVASTEIVHMLAIYLSYGFLIESQICSALTSLASVKNEFEGSVHPWPGETLCSFFIVCTERF